MKEKVSANKIREVCQARNGERCKDCIYYGKICEQYKRRFNGYKPIDWIDEREMKKYFAD